MTDYGIKIVGYGLTQVHPPEWVVEFDPNRHAPGKPYPTGFLVSDADPAKAQRFATAGEAMSLVREQSTACPLRPDGRVNRPLMAFTTAIEPLP